MEYLNWLKKDWVPGTIQGISSLVIFYLLGVSLPFIVTIQSGLIHPEFHTYPVLALRETLLNAFGHRDYRLLGSAMLKQYKDKLIITNPGEFIGGITPIEKK